MTSSHSTDEIHCVGNMDAVVPRLELSSCRVAQVRVYLSVRVPWLSWMLKRMPHIRSEGKRSACFSENESERGSSSRSREAKERVVMEVSE